MNIKFSAADTKQVRDCAERTAAFLRNNIAKLRMDVDLLGPAPSPLERIKDKVRWQLLLKGSKPNALHNLCYLLQEEYVKLSAGKVRLSIDVDPESMM